MIIKDFLKKPRNKLASILAVGILTALPFASVLPASAAVNASFSLSPASKTLTVGDNLVVNLVLNNGGNPVSAWKVAINYSTAAFNSVTVAADPASPFTLNPATDVSSGGTIKLTRYALSASSTDGVMAKITLHSTGVGNTSLSFAHICSSTSDATQCSAVTNDSGTNLLATITGGSYTVAAVPVAASTTPAKKKSFVNKVSDAIASVVSPTTEAEPASNVQTFKASRGTVKITVLDKKNKALEGAKVTLAGQSGMTNKNGQVIFTGLYPGEAKGTISYKGKSQSITLTVESDTSLDAPQTASFVFKAAGGSMLLPIFFSIIGLAVVIGLIDLLFISKGGFKPELENILHHGGDHAGSASGIASSTKYSATTHHDRHESMTPGIVIEPNAKSGSDDWKY